MMQSVRTTPDGRLRTGHVAAARHFLQEHYARHPYIEWSVLTFPGTATPEWRSEVSSMLDRARHWFSLEVVIVGRDRFDATMHAAVHALEPDRVIFGGSRTMHTSFVGATALDLRAHRVRTTWLLSSSLEGRAPSSAAESVEKMKLRTNVRILPVRDDVVTPVEADDLEEVFAGFVRSRGKQ